MPFENPVPRALTRQSIQGIAPGVPGIFGLSNSRQWVFIGPSDNIRDDLARLLDDPNSPPMAHSPTGFVFEACRPERQRERCERLIAEYSPVCNSVRTSGSRRYGPEH